MNTWGIWSVNHSTFNTAVDRSVSYPKDIRDKVYTALKINNLTLNVLGYIPGVSIVSGSIRMAIGVAIVIVTLSKGDPNADRGSIIGPFYWEALATGISQIARGALEAFIPFGHTVNLVLDIIATPWNLGRSFFWDINGTRDFNWDRAHGVVNWMRPGKRAMEAPEYPPLLNFLHIV